MTDRKPGQYDSLLGHMAGLATVPDDPRSVATMLARHIEPINGRPVLVPYVYRGGPPSHPGLCDGCGMLHARCRCAKVG